MLEAFLEACPAIALDRDRFARYLGERVGAGDPLATWFGAPVQ
jgi:hypothetical protein